MNDLLSAYLDRDPKSLMSEKNLNTIFTKLMAPRSYYSKICKMFIYSDFVWKSLGFIGQIVLSI